MGRKSRQKQERRAAYSGPLDEYEIARGLPPSERSSRMRQPEWRRAYFRGRSLLFISCLAGALMLNAVSAAIIKENGLFLLFAIFTVAFAVITYVNLRSGSCYSNARIYFRDLEPIRFWTTTLVGIVMMALFSFAVWID